MTENSSRFFRNDKCEYFPCHKGIEPENFNCLFCYCPLALAINCGGSYSVTESGKKDCSLCAYPHEARNYDKIVARVIRLMDARKWPEDGARI